MQTFEHKWGKALYNITNAHPKSAQMSFVC
jgi:hypothetical protein